MTIDLFAVLERAQVHSKLKSGITVVSVLEEDRSWSFGCINGVVMSYELLVSTVASVLTGRKQPALQKTTRAIATLMGDSQPRKHSDIWKDVNRLMADETTTVTKASVRALINEIESEYRASLDEPVEVTGLISFMDEFMATNGKSTNSESCAKAAP